MPATAIRPPKRDTRTPAQQLYDFTRTAGHKPAVRALGEFWRNPKTRLVDYAELGRLDRFFLLMFLLRRPDVNHPWLYERCRQVEEEPYGCLDLWARYHYKSTIITFAGTIQELLRDPEICIAIFSYNKFIATAFLDQIKTELETNGMLKKIYSDILYEHPTKQSPAWSRQQINVKRKAVRREGTVSAWGLVDGMPTSMHFHMRLYDDVITERNVTNPDQIAKATAAVEMSWNLGTHEDTDRELYIGTRYAFGDTYQVLIDRGAAKLRKYPATNTGTIDGKPVLMTDKKWRDLLGRTTLKNIASQQLLDPLQGSDTTFDLEWVRYYEMRPLTLNVYIICDPARTTKRTSDRTGIAVVGVDAAQNKYLLDGLCHRLTLSERWTWLSGFRRKWMRAPGIQSVHVGYEIYGAHSDLEHFEEQMRLEGERGIKDSYFLIEELKWKRDGPDTYIDRVQRLEPDMKQWRFFFPYDEMITREDFEARKLRADDVHGRHQGLYLVKTRRQIEAQKAGSDELVAKPIIQRNESGDAYNLVEWMLKNEYVYFPNIHVDFMDALSRLYDMKPLPPARRNRRDLIPAPEPDG